MVARSPHEPHRVATPLEVFFDLVFVVAIAMAANSLHHAVAENHAAHGLIGYGLVFFAIWWAWVNFTWFASAYDCDDVPYRLTVFLQLTGALIMASGVPAMFEHRMANWAVVGGYVVMRFAGVAQWLRAAKADPPRRRGPRRSRRAARNTRESASSASNVCRSACPKSSASTRTTCATPKPNPPRSSD
jgi:low temperature requirement protein LtrA